MATPAETAASELSARLVKDGTLKTAVDPVVILTLISMIVQVILQFFESRQPKALRSRLIRATYPWPISIGLGPLRRAVAGQVNRYLTVTNQDAATDAALMSLANLSDSDLTAILDQPS